MMLPEPAKAALRYIRNVLKGLDILANTIMGGEPRETISERAARLRDNGVAYGCVLCRMLDVIERDHCDKVRDRLAANREGR